MKKFTDYLSLSESVDSIDFWNRLSGAAQRHWLQSHPNSKFHDSTKYRLKDAKAAGDDAETAANISHEPKKATDVIKNIRDRHGLAEPKKKESQEDEDSEDEYDDMPTGDAKEDKVNWKIKVPGWGSYKISRIEIDDSGELRVTFPSKVKDHPYDLDDGRDEFTDAIKQKLVDDGYFDEDEVEEMVFSEQGMQGEDYASFDVGEELYDSFKSKNSKDDEDASEEKSSKSGKSTGAKEVKGKTAQDVLASKDSPTDFEGPKDAKSSLSGDVEAEKKVVTEINKIGAWASKIFKQEKSLAQKYEDEGYKKDAAKKKAADEMKNEKDKYSLDLCKVSVPGTNLFCGDNKGIPRKEMPQLKGNALAGTEAAKLEANEDGEVSAEEEFKKHLKMAGHTMVHKKVDASSLKATQSQLVGTKVAGMYEALKKDPKHEKIGAPIFVSKDGYILDGHHRWAAHVALDLADGLDVPVAMDVIEVDMGIEDLVDATNKFANSFGIAQKSGDGGKEKKEVKESVEINEARTQTFGQLVESIESLQKKERELSTCPKSPNKGSQYMMSHSFTPYRKADETPAGEGRFACRHCGIKQLDYMDKLMAVREQIKKEQTKDDMKKQQERLKKQKQCEASGGHDYENTAPYNRQVRGYNSYTCKKCEHSYDVDSGD